MSNVLLFVYFSDKITDKFKKLSIVHNLFLLSPLAKKKKRLKTLTHLPIQTFLKWEEVLGIDIADWSIFFQILKKNL